MMGSCPDRRRILSVAAICLGAAGWGGCGGSSSALRDDVRRLTLQVEDLRRNQHAMDERLSQIGDHTYALEDRVARAATGAAPAHRPVVRLRTAEEADAAPAAVPVDGDVPAEPAPAPPADNRPVLRIEGRRERAARSAGPTGSAGPVERLPLAALPGDREGAIGPVAQPALLADDPLAAVHAYEAAYALVRERRFDEALASFEEFLRRYPQHPYADNALYWRGEAYYAQGQYLRAVGEFERLLQRFPDGNKAPDALLKLGLCYQSLGDARQASTYLTRVRADFPHSDAAREAGRRLAARAEARP